MIEYIEDKAWGIVTIEEKPLWWQKKGLSYTTSGYGNKIPTTKMALVRWDKNRKSKRYRVYCAIHSNAGSCYIVSCGKKYYLR